MVESLLSCGVVSAIVYDLKTFKSGEILRYLVERVRLLKEHVFCSQSFNKTASERGKSRRRFCYQIFPGGNNNHSDWLIDCHVSDCIEMLNFDEYIC